MKYLILYIGLIIIVLTISSCMKIIPSIAPGVNAEKNIGDQFDFTTHYVEVLGSKMHYVDEGQGEVVIMLHGNPTSSYLWRNIIPKVSETHRVIAPDLIGMGKSDKPDIEYTLQDHIRYFTAFVNELDLQDITLVMHDWGGGIGLSYHTNSPGNVKRLVLMEAVIKPFYWGEVDMMTEYIFKNLRDEDYGYKLIVEENYFVEKLLPMFSGRELSQTEMDFYRAPYVTKASRKPIRKWPQEIAIDEEPRRNYLLIRKNYEFLKIVQDMKPILILYGEPGAIFNSDLVSELRQNFPGAEFQSIGPGMHYLQEAQPTRISNVLATWLNKNEGAK